MADIWENTSLLFPFVFQIFQVEGFVLNKTSKAGQWVKTPVTKSEDLV